MIGTVFAFMAGIMLTWPALVVLLVLGILFEHNDSHGWAVFTGLVAITVAFFFFDVPLGVLAIGAVIYLMVGLCWSFWRYKRHVDDTITEHKGSCQNTKNHVLTYLQPKEMLGTITTWIIVWPFSMIENLTSDIINGIQTLVQRVFHGVYNRIYESAVSALK